MRSSKKLTSKSVPFLLVVFIISFLPTDSLLGQPAIQVNFLEPSQDGQEVGITTEVTGKAVLPDDNFLWVLAHRIKDYEKSWWPQGRAIVDPKKSTWKMNVQFGAEQDIGYQFEIAVITVSKVEHEKLTRYWFMVKNTGRSTPIKMPQTTSPPKYRIVKKVSH